MGLAGSFFSCLVQKLLESRAQIFKQGSRRLGEPQISPFATPTRHLSSCHMCVVAWLFLHLALFLQVAAVNSSGPVSVTKGPGTSSDAWVSNQGPGCSKLDKANPLLVKFSIAISEPANCMQTYVSTLGHVHTCSRGLVPGHRHKMSASAWAPAQNEH